MDNDSVLCSVQEESQMHVRAMGAEVSGEV